MSALLGPDGKEMQGTAMPPKRGMMSRQEKFNMVFMVFTVMNREERAMLRKMLKPLQRELDFKYPMGMTQDDIKRDVEKIQAEVANEATADTLSVVPDPEGSAIPVVPEGQPADCVPVQPESDEIGEEGSVGC